MTSLTRTDYKPLIAPVGDDCTKPLAVLFASYPEPYSEKGADYARQMADARVTAYRIALEGLPSWAIGNAVLDFIQGRVERKRRDRLPTAEELAAISRKLVDEEAQRQKLQADRIAQAEERRRYLEAEEQRNSPEAKAMREAISARVMAPLRAAQSSGE